MPEPVKVLSIDGGGIRGIIPATVLAEVERRTGRAIADLFDLIAGTSTGGLIALALAAPGEGGRPRWRAADLIALYEAEGPRIFSRSLVGRVLSGFGLIDERYSDAALDAALERYLGGARLSEALTPLLVSAYSLEKRGPFFFKTARARADPRRDYPMRAAARATAAAPTYFEPEQVVDEDGESVGLVDGGVCLNNPAMSAYAEARRDGAGDILVASLGTGEQTRPIAFEKARMWGALEWVRPLIDVMFDGMSDVVDYQLDHVLGSRRYYRFQTRLDRAQDDLDDASARNLALLHEEAAELVKEAGPRIDELCTALTG
jgi:patatin-like phospholipase/acyl hydrolase